MSQPNIPDINPEIKITRGQSINLLLSSIAMEELGLAHIINAEGEKIQAAVGTLKDDLGKHIPGLACNIRELEGMSKSVNKTLQTIIKKEMLLQLKLENILELISNKHNHDNCESNCDNSKCGCNSEYDSKTNLKEAAIAVTTENPNPELPPENNE